MAFTYDTTTDIGKIRLKIGDTVDGDGVKPAGGNFTDAEIQVFLDEGGANLLAAALACDALASLWTNSINRFASGEQQFGRDNPAQQWRDMAARLRQQGRNITATQAKVYGVT